MESYLYSGHYDLVTPDGAIANIYFENEQQAAAEVLIEKISPAFVGYDIDNQLLEFNLKSSLAQLGLNSTNHLIDLDAKNSSATIQLQLQALNPLGEEVLKLITPGARIGKLFAADDRRRVRNPDYLLRMFGRSDQKGNPLLSLGGAAGSDYLSLEKIDGRTVAYLALKQGRIEYDSSILGYLPTVAKALCHNLSIRDSLKLNQQLAPNTNRTVLPGEMLLVQTLPLHIRTAFGKVVDELLPPGFHHTRASVLQPDTKNSGDIYELYGKSNEEISDIPLEFYTLEPHREHVFFSDRDQFQTCLEDPKILFKAFETAPSTNDDRAAVFVVKGEQLLNLSEKDWITREHKRYDFPGIAQSNRQALMVERYIEQQPSYPFLKAMEDNLITSQGVLLTRYFPSPLMKRVLLSNQVRRSLKRIYFQKASHSSDSFFSHEDRAFLLDLAKFAIPTYWVDEASGQILQYIQKRDKDCGMFVPLDSVTTFVKATVFGIYGSNLTEGNFEQDLYDLFKGILKMSETTTHPLLASNIPLALVTGGGPGAMELGNRIAKSLGILSCANIVDFTNKGSQRVNEQHVNPYIDAKMTYRLDRLVERQAEFHLHLPIFVMGGIGTDFELALEEVRTKVGSRAISPMILFGSPEYWKAKITSRFRCNRESGTIIGSEWVSNNLYCVKNAAEALHVYHLFFTNQLPIGPNGIVYDDGFCTVSKHLI
ncbi:MAG: LOG family protein [Chlamydiota bacterium]